MAVLICLKSARLELQKCRSRNDDSPDYMMVLSVGNWTHLAGEDSIK